MRRNLIALFIAITVLLAGCGGGQVANEVTPTPFPTPVRSAFLLERGDIAVQAKLSGHVSALTLHTVYFEISGQVREVYANINNGLTEGQLLGVLDNTQELRANAEETQNTMGIDPEAVRIDEIDAQVA